MERGFDHLIYVLGADHGGYVKRLEALARAVTDGRVELTVMLCQLVKLYRGGEPVRMSKRSATSSRCATWWRRWGAIRSAS